MPFLSAYHMPSPELRMRDIKVQKISIVSIIKELIVSSGKVMK